MRSIVTPPGKVPNWEWAASEGKPKPPKLPHSGWAEVSEWSWNPGRPSAGNPAELRDIFKCSSPIICNKWPKNKHKRKTEWLRKIQSLTMLACRKKEILPCWIWQCFINPTHNESTFLCFLLYHNKLGLLIRKKDLVRLAAGIAFNNINIFFKFVHQWKWRIQSLIYHLKWSW